MMRLYLMLCSVSTLYFKLVISLLIHRDSHYQWGHWKLRELKGFLKTWKFRMDNVRVGLKGWMPEELINTLWWKKDSWESWAKRCDNSPFWRSMPWISLGRVVCSKPRLRSTLALMRKWLIEETRCYCGGLGQEKETTRISHWISTLLDQSGELGDGSEPGGLVAISDCEGAESGQGELNAELSWTETSKFLPYSKKNCISISGINRGRIWKEIYIVAELYNEEMYNIINHSIIFKSNSRLLDEEALNIFFQSLFKSLLLWPRFLYLEGWRIGLAPGIISIGLCEGYKRHGLSPGSGRSWIVEIHNSFFINPWTEELEAIVLRSHSRNTPEVTALMEELMSWDCHKDETCRETFTILNAFLEPSKSLF